MGVSLPKRVRVEAPNDEWTGLFHGGLALPAPDKLRP